MAHRVMVNGTIYGIEKGKTLVNGTVYDIEKGKTMVNGTAREIALKSKYIPVSITQGLSSSSLTTYAYVRFKNSDGTTVTTCSAGEYEMVRGNSFSAYVKNGNTADYSAIYLNDELVEQAVSSAKTYTFTPDCESITVKMRRDAINQSKKYIEMYESL